VSTIEGYTLATFQDPDEYPELKARHEDQTREAFRARYGRAPTGLFWSYAPPMPWEDPETGEILTMAEYWSCIAEGVRP